MVSDKRSILETFLAKINAMLKEELTEDQFNQTEDLLPDDFFPDDWDHEKPGRASNEALYPDLTRHDKGRRSVLFIKRVIDIAGSLARIMILCAPVFIAIALAVKFTSKGPVFFRQRRVGRYGKTFTFLKFRSMYVNNDASVHKEFVTRLIASQSASVPTKDTGTSVYKLTNDKRITNVGKFLRRTSLDELPQFLNVLAGDMSLVGPRPPIPYELAAYQT